MPTQAGRFRVFSGGRVQHAQKKQPLKNIPAARAVQLILDLQIPRKRCAVELLCWVDAAGKVECNIVFSSKLQFQTCIKVALQHCMASIFQRSHMTLSFLFFNFNSTLVRLSSIYFRYRNLFTWYRAGMAPLKGLFPSLPSWKTMKKEWKRSASKQVLHQVIHKPTGAVSSN